MVDTSDDWLRLTSLGDGSTRDIAPVEDKDLVRVEGGIGDFSITVPMDRSLDDWAAIQARIDVYHGDRHLFRGYLYDTDHREMAGDGDTPGQTVLEGEGIGKDFTDAEIADHLDGDKTKKTYADTTLRDALLDYFSLLPEWSATVYESDTEIVESDASLQSADSTSELAGLINPGETDPWAAQNGVITPLQAGFLLTEDLNPNTVSGSEYNGGVGYGFGNSIFTSISPDYKIPSGALFFYRFDVPEGGHPEFEINVQGNTIASVAADFLTAGPSWRSELIDFDITPGSTSVEIVRGSDSGSGTAVIDAIAITDDRYIDPPSNTLSSSGYLQGPDLFPSVTIPFTEAPASLAIESATATATINDTSGSQRIQLSFDGGSSWQPSDGSEQNTSSVTAQTDSATRSVQPRVTLGAYGSRTDAAPTDNYLPQQIDVWDLTADLSDETIVDQLTLDGSDWENITTLLDYGGYRLVIHHREDEKAVTAFNRGNAQAERSADWRELSRDTGISGQKYGNSVIVEGAERADGTRPRAIETDDQALAEDGREIRPGNGKVTDLSVATEAGARFQALAILELAQERGKRRGTITAAPTVVEPGFAYPVDFGNGTEYIHLDEWQLGDETDLVFEPSEALGDAIAGNSRGVNEAIRR